MKDNQWPRFEVFQQEKESQPHKNVGSVHAADAEMALQNARDVFVRRPQTRSLWVVPESALLAVSKEELESGSVKLADSQQIEGAIQTYAIFRKTSHRPSMTYVVYSGAEKASSCEGALRRAMERFEGQDTFIWWVCPEAAIVRSVEADIESMFDQAHGKLYRMPKNYRLMSEMMQLKREKDNRPDNQDDE